MRDDGNFGSGTSQQLLPGVTSDTRPLLMPEGGGGGGGGGAGGSGAPGTKPTAEDYAKYAFYNIRKYRPYFDVDTKVCGWEGGQSRSRIITGLALHLVLLK